MGCDTQLPFMVKKSSLNSSYFGQAIDIWMGNNIGIDNVTVFQAFSPPGMS